MLFLFQALVVLAVAGGMAYLLSVVRREPARVVGSGVCCDDRLQLGIALSSNGKASGIL